VCPNCYLFYLQYSYNISTGVAEGAAGEIWDIIKSVNTEFVWLSFENVKLKVMESCKCCDGFEYIAIFSLQ
jgi:hypothetical protein